MFSLINNGLWIHLVKNPSYTGHVREISRTLLLSPATVLKLIQELKKQDLILTEVQGRNLVVRINTENEIFFYLKKWTNLFLLINSGLIEELKKNSAKKIILFGSYSLGEDIEKSDIDLAIDIGKKITPDIFEGSLNRKIQIHQIDMKNKMLLDNIRQGILIYGVLP